jgi:hypothetical protein
MNGVTATGDGGIDHGGHIQVAFRGGGGPHPDRGVRRGHVPGAGIGIGVDGDGTDSQLAGGADDAQGDLAPVGDEQRTDHGGLLEDC